MQSTNVFLMVVLRLLARCAGRTIVHSPGCNFILVARHVDLLLLLMSLLSQTSSVRLRRQPGRLRMLRRVRLASTVPERSYLAKRRKAVAG